MGYSLLNHEFGCHNIFDDRTKRLKMKTSSYLISKIFCTQWSCSPSLPPPDSTSISAPSPFPAPSSSSPSFQRLLSLPFTVSASSSVAVGAETEEDEFPAEVRVTEATQPRSSVRLTVEVPPAVCQECHKKVLVEYSKQVKVPGFRPGKRIPENILINYVGKQNVQGATIEAILKKTLPHAVSSVEGRALKDSHPTSITKFSDMSDTFSLQDILRYDVMVDVAPEVKWLSESKYKNLKVVVELDDSINAQNAAEKEFTRRCKSLGALKIVTDRGLQIGDLVVLDIFATTVEEDESKAQKIPSAERKGFHLDTEESDNLLPGFLDAISGIRPDETRSFPLQFPESWEQENLRGVNSQFTVVCKELFYRELPKLEDSLDSLAEKLLPGCSTLNQVQEAIFERCKEAEQTAIEQATDNAILDQLCKLVEVDIPESLFEEQGRQLYGANLLQIHASNKLSEQQLASLSSEKAVKTYLESQRDTITNIVKQMLVVAEIFKGENLEYPTEELVKEVQKSVAEFKRHNQEYDEERIKDQVQDVLEGAKVLEWLRENSEIEFVKK
ncbi:trigger factor-like protein TIG, Chloroplastic [Asparagus officinalis]|uniref:trigger factor-like protein TIG, Chloroplastic n=1 Tax=Asparagus officinalis TaxID=4686 RepID=UPI00098E3778|nr:trigger factor-like protein TIG, Chloroplastic [Asparagus officinalis]